MERPSFDRFRAVKRQAVRLSTEELIKTSHLPGDQAGFPLVIEPAVDNVDLVSWSAGNREFIEAKLLEHGALLFRGFGVASADEFRRAAAAVVPELLDYTERAAPRKEVGKSVFTSTEFPADQWIPMHHEMSYSHNWPIKIWFYCEIAAREGGCTPITDDRRLIGLIPAEIRDVFAERGVMYVRNYGEGVDLPWQEAFQTTERAAVEAYCRDAGMECEWRDGDRLRTRNRRQVFATHPKTGHKVWFNHAHMFHVSNLTPEVREALLSEFAEDELPRNAFYGDGAPIESEVLEEIRQLYHRESVRFPWQQGDVLLVDNILASHGREPFGGPRKVLVAMAELYRCPEL